MIVSLDHPERLVKTLSFYYDDSWLAWSPDVFEATLAINFKYEPSDEVLQRGEALRETLRSDRFLGDPFLFEKVIRAFNDVPLSFKIWEPVDYIQLALGLAYMERVVGREKMEEMNHGVKSYIGSVLAMNEILIAPKEFHFDLGRDEMERAGKFNDRLMQATQVLWDSIKQHTSPDKEEFKSIVKQEVSLAVKGAANSDVAYDVDACTQCIIKLLMAWLYLHKHGSAFYLKTTNT